MFRARPRNNGVQSWDGHCVRPFACAPRTRCPSDDSESLPGGEDKCAARRSDTVGVLQLQITEDRMATTVTSKEDVSEVWKAYKADPSDKALRNRLVERYLPLVKYHGERVWARLPDGIELDDLISAGVFGLMDAIDAYDRALQFRPAWREAIENRVLAVLRRNRMQPPDDDAGGTGGELEADEIVFDPDPANVPE